MAERSPAPWNFDGPSHSVIVWDGNGDRVCFMTSDGPAEENARLIIAAPELLSALGDLYAAMACHSTTPEEKLALASAKDALSKAGVGHNA